MRRGLCSDDQRSQRRKHHRSSNRPSKDRDMREAQPESLALDPAHYFSPSFALSAAFFALILAMAFALGGFMLGCAAKKAFAPPGVA